jgi:heme-degrading monooxygenase HmoA
MFQIGLLSTNSRFHTFLRGVHEVTEEHNSAHVISLFRFRMRDLTPVQREEYSSTAERLLTLASAMPGFISFRHYTSDDGELLAVVEFASAETLAAWRDHPDHRMAQQRGRNEFYADYEIINCAVLHRYGYKP